LVLLSSQFLQALARPRRNPSGLTVGELLLILLVVAVAIGGTVLAFLGFSGPKSPQPPTPPAQSSRP
jgi:hypothetical protein